MLLPRSVYEVKQATTHNREALNPRGCCNLNRKLKSQLAAKKIKCGTSKKKISYGKTKLFNQVLRLWPANLGLGFHCDDSDCRTPGDEIKNSGFNRLNCFLCDYDICMACANRKICEKQRGLCCLLLKCLNINVSCLCQ